MKYDYTENMSHVDFFKWENLTFEKYRKLAVQNDLDCYGKIAAPKEYRKGKEGVIFKDILSKLTNLKKENLKVLDIGPGCTPLTTMIMDFCLKKDHKLFLIDSQEMLSLIPQHKGVTKISGRFPEILTEQLEQYSEYFDVVLAYNVFHIAFEDSNPYHFIDTALKILAHNGQLLLGDVPSFSMRKRFFSSPTGVLYHQKFTGTKALPEVTFNQVDFKKIDDSVLLSIVQRARSFGYNAYLMPLGDELPMSNRREDILIRRP